MAPDPGNSRPAADGGAAPRGRGPQPKWTRQSLAERIRALHVGGGDLSITALRKASPAILSAAQYLFGGYAHAVRAAGIDYESVRRHHYRWTRQEVIDRLRARHRPDGSLRPGVKDPENWGLYHAAAKFFGTYDGALVAAGIDPNKVAGRGPGRHKKTTAPNEGPIPEQG